MRWVDGRWQTNLETHDFELHELHLLICVKLCIGGSCLPLGGMKTCGAEGDTVGVQGPVGSDLLMYECVVWGIDGCSEGIGCVARKVVDIQVVREEVGKLIQVVLA